MGRRKIEVDQDKLIEFIEIAERENDFPNRSALYEDVAKRFDNPRINGGVVYLRVKEYGLEERITTAKGKVGGGRKTCRADKFAAHKSTFTKMRKEFPKQFHHLIDKAEKGSVNALIKLKCLDCAGMQTAEVRKCPVKLCPLYLIRGYK